MATLTATIKDEKGETVGLLVLDEKTFKTGNVGYFGQGKLAIGGKRYQAQCQLAAIKPKEASAE
jgi:hypothetical protein